MKQIIQITLLIFLLQTTFTNAQSDINVIATGECTDGSAIYTYNGLLNGKNNYINTFISGGETIVLNIGFDGTQWVWYLDGNLTDFGFFNTNVPAGLLPPFTGWQLGACTDGTMVINEVLSNQEFENSKIALYPNPATDFVFIKNNTQNLEYVIFDSNGRTVKEGTTSQKIEVASLQKGLYLIKMNNFSYKFLKQ
jgi:Secretion system C-terminal sorting domain